MHKLIYLLCSCLLLNSCSNINQDAGTKLPVNKGLQTSMNNGALNSSGGAIEPDDSFSIIKTFQHSDKDEVFTCDDIVLRAKGPNRFTLSRKGLNIGEIDLSGSNYDGPGFTMYAYQSGKNRDIEVIIIEAAADIGTAWYYAITLNKHTIVDEFYIKEPRGNSETTKIQDFIKISKDKEGVLFRFNKRKIAPYSKIPADLDADGDYVYLKHRNIGEIRETDLSIAQPPVIMQVTKDINKDGIVDKIVVYKNTDLKDKYDQDHFGLPVKIYKGTDTGFRLWQENSNITYTPQSSCVSEGIRKVVVNNNYFTIESQTCYDYNILVEGYTTFKVTGDDIYLHKYGEVYFDKSKHDKVIPSKTWTTKDFGAVKFEHTTSDFLEHLRSGKN